jgi:DNA end-binding protein Ku
MKQKGLVSHVDATRTARTRPPTTNVVDFMSLLQKSLASNKRTPAAKSAARRGQGRAGEEGPAKKSVAKAAKTSAKKSARARASRPEPCASPRPRRWFTPRRG